jgi:glutamate-5-semialdehyde dehydrogenase
MENVDTAAVYHNASTRFTDGGQFGLAVNLPSVQTSCIKEAQLVYNTWLPINGIYGEGQIR